MRFHCLKTAVVSLFNRVKDEVMVSDGFLIGSQEVELKSQGLVEISCKTRQKGFLLSGMSREGGCGKALSKLQGPVHVWVSRGEGLLLRT